MENAAGDARCHRKWASMRAVINEGFLHKRWGRSTATSIEPFKRDTA